jgi:hypothetical protein
VRRARYALMFIVFSTAGLSAQQTAASAARRDRVPLEKGLAVVADVVEQTYCQIDDEAFAVRMTIKLRFNNVSDRPLILARTIENPPIVRVAKNARDAQHGHLEYDPYIDYFPTTLPSAPRFGDGPDEQYFITLLPQQTYEATVTSELLNNQHGRAPNRTWLVPKGSHVLQLGINVWPYQWPYFDSPVSSQQLSRRWSKYGHLATGWVYSDPVPFTIPEQFDNPWCQPPKS